MRLPELLPTDTTRKSFSQRSKISEAAMFVNHALISSENASNKFDKCSGQNFNTNVQRSIVTPNLDENKLSDNLIKDNFFENVMFGNKNTGYILTKGDCDEPLRKITDIYIPRGIINPNYPGFQKFAHTLTDDLIAYSVTDYYESDLSDNDIEEEGQACCNEEFIISTNPASCLVENGNLSSLVDPVSVNGKQSMTSAMIPDIVNANCISSFNKSFENPDKPDLLYTVNSKCLANQGKSLSPSPKPWHYSNTNHKDNLSGYSPINIIGDFGEEVERELDLLVSGYKNLRTFENFQAFSPTKTSDAELSNASEALKLTFSTQYDNDNRKQKKKCLQYGNDLIRSKYQKSSHDDRQLPPVIFDYKQSRLGQRKETKSGKSEKNISVNTINNKDDNSSKDTFDKNNKTLENNSEICQYKQILNNKDQIIERSRYVKTSCWAQYLQDPLKHSLDLSSPTTLEQFDAYKVANDMDMETLQNHFQMAKEIEKKRRCNRDKICKRLALEDGYPLNNLKTQLIMDTNNKNITFNDYAADEPSSDTESHSSDSETCPKLSKGVARSTSEVYSVQSDQNGKLLNDYHQNILKRSQNTPNQKTKIQINKECVFFAKQSKLQIEVRMALAQSKEIAQMKMEARKRIEGAASIVGIIRSLATDVGINMGSNNRWISRQLLTGVNTIHLQLLVDSLHVYIKNLNSILLENLKERDDLNFAQDTILHDLEQINNFIVSKEQEEIGHQY